MKQLIETIKEILACILLVLCLGYFIASAIFWAIGTHGKV